MIYETKDISGVRNETTFTLSLIDNRTYEWNCYACDTSNNCNFSESNFTFTINTSYYVPIPISFYQYPTVSFYNETTEIILFETNVDVNGTVEYWPEGGAIKIKNLTNYSKVHEFNITGLTPGTKYNYRINLTHYASWGESNISFNSSFVTADYSLTSFTFVVVGDMREQDGSTGVETEIFSNITARILEINPDLVINVGDVVEAGTDNIYGNVKVAWKAYTDVVWNLTDHIPVFIGIGNHERPYLSNPLKRYREVVIHPLNGNGSDTCDGPCWNETTYWFRYGNSLFISLNTEEKGIDYEKKIVGNQQEWLNKTLNMTGFINRFVFLHRPVKGALEDTVTNPNELDQIFDDYNVTAVFAGHEHYYCRNNTATLYIITGGGGAPLVDANCAATNNAKAKEYHFVNITVQGDTIYGNAINMSNGAVLDTFEWTTPS